MVVGNIQNHLTRGEKDANAKAGVAGYYTRENSGDYSSTLLSVAGKYHVSNEYDSTRHFNVKTVELSSLTSHPVINISVGGIVKKYVWKTHADGVSLTTTVFFASQPLSIGGNPISTGTKIFATTTNGVRAYFTTEAKAIASLNLNVVTSGYSKNGIYVTSSSKVPNSLFVSGQSLPQAQRGIAINIDGIDVMPV